MRTKIIHNSMASENLKIKRMIREKGNESYGIFWVLIEMLAQEKNHKLKADYRDIALNLKESTNEVKDIIENYDLFTVLDGYFTSENPELFCFKGGK